MTPERFETLLAESLAGEISDADRAELESKLRSDPHRAARAGRLQAVAAELRRALGSAPVAPPAPLRGVSQRSAWGVAARFAALVLISFGAGYAARGPAAPPSSLDLRSQTGDTAAAGALLAGVDGPLAARYASAVRRLPNATSFTRSLLAVARP